MLKVSIIISNFNYGAFLASSIESALSQTHRPCEVIVVDDGSVDNSNQILDAYKAKLQVFNIQHQGETASRNFGFSKSSGDLVCFLDADDYLQPDTASKVVSFWKPEFTKVQYPLRVVDEQGLDQRLQMPRCPLDSGIVYPSLLRTGRYITSPGSGNFYSRALLEKIMPVPVDEWPQSFDSYASTYAAFLGEVGAIQTPLGSYRVHSSNMSRAVNGNGLQTGQIDKLLERQLRLRRLIERIAGENKMQTSPHIVTSHWLYLKLELAKRAHQPDTSTGEALAIVRKMIVSAASAPELSFAKRLQLIGWAIGSALLPKALSQYIMAMGFDLAPENRFARAMRRL